MSGEQSAFSHKKMSDSQGPKRGVTHSGSKYTTGERESRNKKLGGSSFNNPVTSNTLTGLENININKTSGGLKEAEHSRNQALATGATGTNKDKYMKTVKQQNQSLLQ